MNRLSIFSRAAAALVAAALALAAAPHPATPMSTSTTVDISDYAFKAQTITIHAGESVTWTNRDDDPHTVTADDGSFDSKGLGQGDHYTHVFRSAGRFPYHCAAHPFMKGVVVVIGGAR